MLAILPGDETNLPALISFVGDEVELQFNHPGSSIVIGNSIVRNNSMPNDIVKANTNIIMPESYTGLHKLKDICKIKCSFHIKIYHYVPAR